MESMNFFGDNDKSSEALFENTKQKKKTYTEDFKKKAVNLASEIGATKAAEELGISTSSIYSWQKTLAKLPTPIQDENGNLTFTLEGKTYSLNVNSEEERERVKTEVNTNSLAKYEWFKEETGKRHWVLYNIEMYEIKDFISLYLHYKEDSNLIPIIPINATSCYSMFKDCSRLTTLDIRNFDTSGVIDMRYMFKTCSKLTSLDFTGFDTSNATDMSEMFCNCEALTKLDLSNFNTRNVTNMYCMFNGCHNLTQLDLSSFNTSNVTDMHVMFGGCSNLTSLDINNFDTSNVTEMHWMFYNCESLTQLDLSSFNTSKVTNMSFMFSGCESLTQLDLSNFDTSKVTDMGGMFTYCTELTNIFISNKWNADSIKYSEDMFDKCCSLPGFSRERTGIEMAKPVEHGGYLTLKK